MNCNHITYDPSCASCNPQGSLQSSQGSLQSSQGSLQAWLPTTQQSQSMPSFFGIKRNSPTMEERLDDQYGTMELGEIVNYFLEEQKSLIELQEADCRQRMANMKDSNERRAETFWTWLEKKYPGVTKERMLKMKAFL